MQHIDVPDFLKLLVITIAAAKAVGIVAQRVGQPAVLGELLAGVLLGVTLGGVLDPSNQVFHLFAEIGVVLLLFEIGLETDVGELLGAGATSTVVALVGVVVPFGLGFLAAYALGLSTMAAVVCGAALTATSVGITARVLSDLGRLQEAEGRIILGAAVIDDIVGLVILTVVAAAARGKEVDATFVVTTAAVAFGFLIIALAVGMAIVPLLVELVASVKVRGALTVFALVAAFGMAWLADLVGSAMIIGAFTAGLVLRRSKRATEIEQGIGHLGHFFVPLFFVYVGAAVDLRLFNPFERGNWNTLAVGGLLIAAAIAGKFVAGFAPVWFKGRKTVIGIGMIPRGEVGLIFANMGLASGVFDSGLFSAVTLMVMVTTFMVPPLLKLQYPPVKRPAEERELEEF
jgi:Kef-type K+ transport system membrane component KefB